jgi:hypothetical protein
LFSKGHDSQSKAKLSCPLQPSNAFIMQHNITINNSSHPNAPNNREAAANILPVAYPVNILNAPRQHRVVRRIASQPRESIVQPSRDENILTCSKVLHNHIIATINHKLDEASHKSLNNRFIAPTALRKSVSEANLNQNPPSTKHKSSKSFNDESPSYFLKPQFNYSREYSLSPSASISVSISSRNLAELDKDQSHSSSRSNSLTHSPSSAPLKPSTPQESPTISHISPSEHIQQSFDIDNFMQKHYNVRVPIYSSVCNYTTYSQQAKANVLPIPTQQHIYRFIKRVFDRAQLNAECVIICLIYIERLLDSTELKLSHRNWIPVVTVALLIASKVWDDHSSFNAEFAQILPIFSLKAINSLERLFLTSMQYDLYISPSDYARYYFGLRAMRGVPEQNNYTNPSKASQLEQTQATKEHSAAARTDYLRAGGSAVPKFYQSIGIGIHKHLKHDLQEQAVADGLTANNSTNNLAAQDIGI